MTEEEIDAAVEAAILNTEIVRADRACTAIDHAETDAEVAALERLGAFAKAARTILADVVALEQSHQWEVIDFGEAVYPEVVLRPLMEVARALLNAEQ